MQVAALPTPVHRAANSRPTPEISPAAANRLARSRAASASSRRAAA